MGLDSAKFVHWRNKRKTVQPIVPAVISLGLMDYFPLNKVTAPQIYSRLFTCMKIASTMTLVCCIMVTTRQFLGNNINCTTEMATVDDEEMAVVESYCFIAAIFTISNMTLPYTAPHPGLGPVPHREYFPPGTEPQAEGGEDGTTTHAYYQWVPFMLALQFAILRVPVSLWRHKQGDYFNTVLNGLHMIYVDQPDVQERSAVSASMFRYSMKHLNKTYFYHFIFFEVMGFFLAVGNLFLTNIFLGGRFFYFGKGALSYLTLSATDPNNPLNIVFPKMGKCTWYTYGVSGSIQSQDAMCVLPLNIVNEKTYIVLWVAYVTLCVVTGLILLYHLIIFLIPRRLDSLVINKTAESSRDAVRSVLVQCDVGDKFLMWNLQSKITDFPLWIQSVRDDGGRAEKNLDKLETTL